MRKNLATALAFMAASLFAAIALVIQYTARVQHIEFIDALAWVLIVYFYIQIVVLIVALPIFCLLDYFQKITWWSSTIGGVLTGTLAFAIFNLQPAVVVVGGVSGLVFWLIWMKGTVKQLAQQ